MKPLSPVDAIAPAFARMRTLLVPPASVPGQASRFRFGFFLKIAVVAALTSTGFYSGSIVIAVEAFAFGAMATGISLAHSAHPVTSPGAVVLAAAALIGGICFLALWILLAWLWSRLRFTLFELVVDGHGRVGFAWSHYASRAWRYLGISVLALLALLVLLVATAGPLVLHLFVLLRRLSPEQINADPTLVFAHILPLYGIIIPFGLLVALVDAILLDFILPAMALENAPIERAAGRFLQLVRAHLGQVTVYFILRLVLIFGFTAFGGLLVFLVLLVFGGTGGAIGFALYHALWHAGPGGAALFILFCAIAAVIVLSAYLLTLTCLHGLIAVFRSCFAVCYYGSHYPELGSRLEPPSILPAAAAPPPGIPPAMPSPPPVW